ncbi:FUSC family protein [Mesorhizobium sp. ASY16-5R]|uniref:FUSC family protein n=1 Tax=Mesorhizobium sp. ASY16-5R TaxID=3445772 RepID=UPI003F9F2DA7
MQRAIGQTASLAMIAARPVLSVAFAVWAAHALGLEDTWWAAISAVMVMQESFGASFYRGLLRMAGTICGAAIAVVLGPLIAPHLVLFVVVTGLATWGCLYSALVFRHSYAWVLALVTFVMVACEAVNPQGHLGAFALERVANVAVGTAGCILVVGLMDISLVRVALNRGKGWRDLAVPMVGRLSDAPIDSRDAALHALQGAVAMLFLSLAVGLWHIGPLAQGMVTTVAVMIVPLDTARGDPHALVVQRMAQRFAGCLLAGGVALALFPLIEAKPLLCQIALAAGVGAGTVVQAVAPGLRYAAVQFTVAFLMVFVQDQGWSIEERPALERLAGVLAGIATLYAVFVIFQNRARRS